MKNIKKRVLSLIMAATVVCSVSMTSFAAETSTTETTAVSETNTSNGESASNSARSLQALTDILSVTNISTGRIVTGHFDRTVSPESYITIMMRGDTTCTVTVKGRWGDSESRYIAGPGTYTIARGQGDFSYEIRYHNDASSSVYQFFQTDNYY